jgi:hypothetical protein
VIALAIYLVLIFINAMVYFTLDVNVDSAGSYDTKDALKTVQGGLMYKVVMFVLYLKLICTYTKYAYEMKERLPSDMEAGTPLAERSECYRKTSQGCRSCMKRTA